MKAHKAYATSSAVFLETAHGAELLRAIFLWAEELKVAEEGSNWAYPVFRVPLRGVEGVRQQEPEFGRGLIFSLPYAPDMATRKFQRFLGQLKARLSPALLADMEKDEETLANLYQRDASRGF